MTTVRSFIAIELPEDIKAALQQLQNTLKAQSPREVRWVDPGGIHLTLKFLGDVETERLEAITQAISEVTQKMPPFRLVLQGTGCFPNLRRPRVIWVGVQGDLEPLGRLQEGIEESMAALGFAREDRAYTPHLTLGRVREGARGHDVQRLGEQIGALKWQGSGEFSVGSVHLIRSDLTPRGAIYTKLASAKLAA